MRNLASNNSVLANNKTRIKIFNRHVPLLEGDEFGEG